MKNFQFRAGSILKIFLLHKWSAMQNEQLCDVLWTVILGNTQDIWFLYIKSVKKFIFDHFSRLYYRGLMNPEEKKFMGEPISNLPLSYAVKIRTWLFSGNSQAVHKKKHFLGHFFDFSRILNGFLVSGKKNFLRGNQL